MKKRKPSPATQIRNLRGLIRDALDHFQCYDAAKAHEMAEASGYAFGPRDHMYWKLYADLKAAVKYKGPAARKAAKR